MTTELVSIHGGHSGQFCNHAQDTLEEIIQAYIAKGFSWVGITEHMPPSADRFLYPEERSLGLDVQSMQTRFSRYMTEARRLQQGYADRLEIFIGFETETYTDSTPTVQALMQTYQPDYIVGSVHHVDDIAFDYSLKEYQRAIQATGDIEALYCRYFDQQYEMIRALQPAVVAHFDLIRLFDPDYDMRWRQPAIEQRITRNLKCIRQLDLILDFNVAALRKGAAEPYVSKPILTQALELGIALVPGDDAHSVDTAGAYIAEGMAVLEAAGLQPDWRKPKVL